MRTYRTLIMLLLIAGAFFTANAQTYYFNKVWEKDFGGYNTETMDGTDLLLLDNNNNIILISSSNSTLSGNKTVPNCGVDTTDKYDIWLLKLDANGDKFYENTYGGLQWEEAKSAVFNPDGSIIMAGASNSNISCDKSENRFGNQLDCWVIKIDSTGQKVWDHRYGTNGEEFIYNIRKGNNGNYMLISYSHDNFNGGNVTDTSHGFSDFLLFNLDSNGGIIWDRFYGSSHNEVGSGIIDSNNNILLAGQTNCISPNGDVSTNGYDTSNIAYADNWIVKIDPTGNILWDKRFGCYGEEYASAVIQNNSGDYVISAIILNDSCIGGDVTDTIPRGHYDIWVYKLDSANGNIISEKRIGGDGFDRFSQIIQLSDNGYLFAGLSNSSAGFDKSENSYNGAFKDFWVVRTDSNFNILWDKTIGGNADESNPNIIVLNDSSFIIASSTYSGISFDKQVPLFDTASSPGSVKPDIWISKWVVTTVNGINEYAVPQFNLYPNPATAMLYVSSKKPLTANTVITVIDIQGRVVMEEKISQRINVTIPIDISKLSQGVYMVSLNNTVQRFVKL